MSEGLSATRDREATIGRIYAMLAALPPEWEEPSSLVETTLRQRLPEASVADTLADLVDVLLDARYGLLERVNRETIVQALAHIRRLSLV